MKLCITLALLMNLTIVGNDPLGHNINSFANIFKMVGLHWLKFIILKIVHLNKENGINFFCEIYSQHQTSHFVRWVFALFEQQRRRR